MQTTFEDEAGTLVKRSTRVLERVGVILGTIFLTLGLYAGTAMAAPAEMPPDYEADVFQNGIANCGECHAVDSVAWWLWRVGVAQPVSDDLPELQQLELMYLIGGMVWSDMVQRFPNGDFGGQGYEGDE